MATREEIQAAVVKAKELMLDCGLDVDATTEDLIEWFDTELPIPDIALDDIVIDPLLVVHELVEIDEVLKMGLTLAKDMIKRNPEKVDDAHLKAAAIEMKIAHSIGAAEHLRDRIGDIESWCVNKALSESRRADYRRLLKRTEDYLSELEHKQQHGPTRLRAKDPSPR
jgi:hypothetical protein